MADKPTKSVSRASEYMADVNHYTDQIPTSPEERLALECIYKVLYQVSGVDFSNYRQSTVMRRLSRRIGLSKHDSIEDYLVYMTDNSKEIDLLYDDLLLFFTEFFRDQHIFGTLKKKIFPKRSNQLETK